MTTTTPPSMGSFPVFACLVDELGNILTSDGQGNLSIKQLVQSGTVYLHASGLENTSGHSADLIVDGYRELAIDATITVIAGTLPSLVLSYSRKAADGLYYVLWSSTTISAIGPITPITIGPTGGAAVQSLAGVGRFSWTIAGTLSPAFTFSASVIGK